MPAVAGEVYYAILLFAIRIVGRGPDNVDFSLASTVVMTVHVLDAHHQGTAKRSIPLALRQNNGATAADI